jgi:hypothetical protein
MYYLNCIGIFLIFILAGRAQCLEGDCENGYGKSDLFYAIYEGTFKDGIPHGAGKLIYDDYIYQGPIREGLEHGSGSIVYKNGEIEEVRYDMGNKKESYFVKVDAKEWKDYQKRRNEFCISGDCNNGIGKYKFPSGNIYEGSFTNYHPEGKGTWYFANGDKYIGYTRNGLKNGQGTYYFNNGWQYTGTYKNDMEYNGTYITDQGRKVNVISGRVQTPEPSVSYTITTGGNVRDPNHRRCPMCSGKGEMTIPGKTTVIRSSAGYSMNTGGARQMDYGVNSVTMPDRTEKCSYCGGNGVIKM